MSCCVFRDYRWISTYRCSYSVFNSRSLSLSLLLTTSLKKILSDSRRMNISLSSLLFISSGRCMRDASLQDQQQHLLRVHGVIWIVGQMRQNDHIYPAGRAGSTRRILIKCNGTVFIASGQWRTNICRTDKKKLAHNMEFQLSALSFKYLSPCVWLKTKHMLRLFTFLIILICWVSLAVAEGLRWV